MEFVRESEMLEPTKRWVESLGLATKKEFSTPWGICDLVGCSLDEKRVEQRLSLGQKKPIGPPLRVSLLLQIPNHTTRRSVTLEKLCNKHNPYIDVDTITDEVKRLVATRFVRVTKNGSFQRVNGWLPLHKRLISVELKLHRIQEALLQAAANRELAWEAYAAFPMSFAERLAAAPKRNDFQRLGVGLLGVTTSTCKVIISPKQMKRSVDPLAQAHCVERFWRSRIIGN